MTNKKSSEDDDERLPVVEAVGLVQVPKGWSVVRLKTQGMRVLEKEVLTEPERHAYALEAVKVAVFKVFMSGPGRARA